MSLCRYISIVSRCGSVASDNKVEMLTYCVVEYMKRFYMLSAPMVNFRGIDTCIYTLISNRVVSHIGLIYSIPESEMECLIAFSFK